MKQALVMHGRRTIGWRSRHRHSHPDTTHAPRAVGRGHASLETPAWRAHVGCSVCRVNPYTCIEIFPVLHVFIVVLSLRVFQAESSDLD